MIKLQSYSDYLSIAFEIWLPIKGFEKYYQISSWGRIKSLARNTPHNKFHAEFVMNPNINSHGYYYLSLYVEAKRTPVSIHRLVAIAFKNNPLNKICVNHLNEKKLDNRAFNLCWATYAENNTYEYNKKTGIGSFTRKPGNTKFTESQVLKVKLLLKEGYSMFEISKMQTDIPKGSINAIKRGHSWASLIV